MRKGDRKIFAALFLSIEWLIAIRFLQGIMSAMIMPLVYAINSRHWYYSIIINMLTF